MNDQLSPMTVENAPRPKPVEIDGHRGSVTRLGDHGPQIVLLPSMLVLGRSYTWLTRILRHHYRLTIVEMPGCGRGSVLSRAWSFERYADWLTKLLEQTPDLNRPTLLAHSNSGPAAVILAAARPDLVGRVVIVDSVGADPPKSLLRVLAGRALDALIETRLTFWGFHHILFNLFRHWRNFWNQVRLAVRYDVTLYAPRVGAPALICWGRRDHTMPLRGGETLARLMPGSTLHVSHAGSHDWLITNAEEFSEVVRAFVANEAPAAPTKPEETRR